MVDIVEEERILIAEAKSEIMVSEEPPNFEFLMMQMCEQRVISWCCID